MIAQRLLPRTVTLVANVAKLLLGRDAQGNGGLEGVLNGATRATLVLTSDIADPTLVMMQVQATRSGTPTDKPTAAPLTVPPSGSLVIELDEQDCAAHAVLFYAQSVGAGDLTVEWEAMR